jgi:hypothetical protein
MSDLMRIAGLVVLSVALSACANLTDYQVLSKDGVEAAQSFEDGARTLRQADRDAELTSSFLQDYNRASPPDSVLKKMIEDARLKNNDIYEDLSQRVAIAVSLKKAYAAFGELANYDASTEVSNSMSGLITSINGLRPEKPIVGGKIAEGIKILAGGIASHYQEKMLADANQLFISILTDYKSFLVEAAPVRRTLREESITARKRLALKLWADRKLSAKKLLDNMNLGFGMETLSAGYYTSRHPGLAHAVGTRIELQAAAELEAVDLASNLETKALAGLIEAHEDIKAGNELSVVAVRDAIQKLLALVERLKAA